MGYGKSTTAHMERMDYGTAGSTPCPAQTFEDMVSEALNAAGFYVLDWQCGIKPPALEVYTSNKSPEFYAAMGIGVREYLQADEFATGQE